MKLALSAVFFTLTFSAAAATQERAAPNLEPRGERLDLTCVRLPAAAVTEPRSSTGPETRMSCAVVPHASWSSRADSMVLGRQFTGLPAPEVAKRNASFPDTTRTLTERQGITETMQPAADADSIDPLINDAPRPTERAEVDPAPASVAAEVMIPLNFACVAVAEAPQSCARTCGSARCDAC